MQSRKLGRAACSLVLAAAWVAAACGDSSSNGATGTGGSSTGSGTLAGGGSDDAIDGGNDPTPGGAGQAGGGITPSAGDGSGAAPDDAGGGGAGGSPTAGVGRLGADCVSAGDCVAGLTCIAPTDLVLGDGAPPHGLCTLACTDSTACNAVSAGALCVPYGETDDGYCMQGCSFGAPPLGQVKCQGRPDQACLPTFLANTNDPCLSADDCGIGEICDTTCQVVLAACLPTCTGDLDCADGLYCNQQFLNGTCIETKPTGKPVGAPCTMPSSTQPDECAGFCQADSADSGDQGHCSTSCGLTSPCGWNSETQKFGGLCLYASAITAVVGGPGDFGFCTPSCDCAAECDTDGIVCEALDFGPLGPDFTGQGLCFAPEPETTPLEACE